jgi:Fic family protein
MPVECLEQTLQLLKDPALVAIRKRAEERPLLWREFTLMRQPQGLSFVQTWALLNVLRRQTAIELASYIVDSNGRRGWYTFTRSMRADFSDIEQRCHGGSRLDSVIRSRNAAHFVVETHISDALSAVREDGVALGGKQAREILLRERPATNPEERVLLNTHRVMLDLESYAGQTCSPDLIRELHRRVSDGVTQRTRPLPALEAGHWLSELSDDEMLEVISRSVNNDGFDETHHPILQAFGLAYLFTSARPLPSWNGVLATLITRLLFLQSRLPVLAFVPIIPLQRSWQDGLIRPPTVPVPEKDSRVVVGDEVDLTIFCATLVRLARLELDATERALQRMLRRDDALSEALVHDPTINHRQRQILATALNDAAAIFTIAAHRALHGVAYATARADLLALADLGFLHYEREGRAFVFAPAPGFSQLIRKRAKAGGRNAYLGDLDVNQRDPAAAAAVLLLS